MTRPCPRCAETERCRCVAGPGPVGRPYGPLQVQLAAETSRLTPTERHLLCTLARRATGTWGLWYGRVDTLALLTGYADRTIQRTLAGLVEAGWLSAEERPGRSTVYRVRAVAVFVAGDELAEVEEVEEAEADPQAEVSRGTEDPRHTITPDTVSPPTQCHPTPDPRSPDQIRDQISTTTPPNPPPAEGGSPGEGWVRDRALSELATVADTPGALARYERAEHGLVKLWLRWARNGTWPDAPSGLRAREVRVGLRAAAAAWRRGERLPPRPPAQLELPEPAPTSADERAPLDEDDLELLRQLRAEESYLPPTGVSGPRITRPSATGMWPSSAVSPRSG